jgi:two-component sensor histidine kinase
MGGIRKFRLDGMHEVSWWTVLRPTADSPPYFRSLSVNYVDIYLTKLRQGSEDGSAVTLASRFESVRSLGSRRVVPRLYQIAIGVLVALIAVTIRYSLPLRPEQIPTLTLVIALPILTMFVGVWAGTAAAVVGGLLSWHLLFDPFSSLGLSTWLPLLSFATIAAVIVTTAHLYGSSERLRHEDEVAALRAKAESADRFAGEMAHRLKNALAIVQSMTFQTIGSETPQAEKLAGRLKALSTAHELLNEHISEPTAAVMDVIQAALSMYDEQHRFRIEAVHALIPSRQVVSLALALHELATNSAQYGSLRNPQGKIKLTVVDHEDRLIFTWKEYDGPAVVSPGHSGFGSRLLQRSGDSAQLSFEADGLRFSMDLRRAGPKKQRQGSMQPAT